MRTLVTIIDLTKGIFLKSIRLGIWYVIYLGLITFMFASPKIAIDKYGQNIMEMFFNNLNNGNVLFSILVINAIWVIFSVIKTFRHYKKEKYKNFAKRDVNYMLITDITEELIMFFLLIIYFWFCPVITFGKLSQFILLFMILHSIASFIVDLKNLETKYHGKENYISG